MTVEECVKSTSLSKVWLCPHIVNDIRFNVDPLLRGVECTKSTVPVDLRTKEVRSTFKEAGALCIIWQND